MIKENNMSLTTFIGIASVKEKFLQEFPSPAVQLNKQIIVPNLSNRYALIGTAADYAIRFYIQHLNPNAETAPWVAKQAEMILMNSKEIPAKYPFDIIPNANKRLKNYLTKRELNDMPDTLLRSAVELATLDTIYRSGRGFEYVGIVHDDDIKELRGVISNLNPETFKASKLCLLNPTFGEGSKLMGGADADMVIDDTLIDIKTVKHLIMKREYLNQLIGYYILSRIGSVGELDPKIEIKKVAIYFSRHSCLLSLNVSDIGSEEKFQEVTEWVKNFSDENIPDIFGGAECRKLIKGNKKPERARR